MAEYSKRLANVTKEYLDSQNWKYSFDNEKGRFIFSIKLKSQLSSCDMMVIIRQDSIMCRASSPINITENARPAIAEYLTRANYGLVSGNFEMDYSDGEVVYKTFLKCGTAIPEMDVVESIVDTPFFMLQRYGDGMLAVMYGGKSPEKAVEEAEA